MHLFTYNMCDIEDGFKIHLANKSEKAHASLKGHNASVLSAGCLFSCLSICFGLSLRFCAAYVEKS